MKRLRALLMDHDGTLVDSEHAHYRMWVDILAPFGLDLPLDDYVRHHAGRSTTSNALRLRKDNPSLTMSVEELIDAKDRAVEEFLVSEAFPLMPGGRAIIDEFVIRGAKAAVVTGADGAGVHVSVRWHGLEELMSTIVSGDQVENGKPAPDGYLLAAERLGVNPAECVAVEDTEAGVSSAATAGVVCIAVPSEMSRTHDFGRADAVVENLTEAREWISSNFEIAG
ncbi:MAG: HAD family phosphatase [Woeseiaceae bacterium]|nr:HAD family phosphatase [Woeseiaceae bacterium]